MEETPELTLPGATIPVAVIGGGPAGLAAAEVLSTAGYNVHLFDAMPSVGRKFLLAGKGGLNLTHSEAHEAFASRYGQRRTAIEPLLDEFGPQAMRDWAAGLGVETFVGSSGRVFPIGMKAAPLLRAWLHRLRHPTSGLPVKLHMRHRWLGWDGVGLLRFDSPAGPLHLHARATVLALGGGSWARLGSDGAWVPWLRAVGVPVTPLQPSNCGFDVVGRHPDGSGAAGWSAHFRTQFAGHPFKSVRLRCVDAQGRAFERKGEFVATENGVEGSLIYAASAWLREQILATGHASFELDLLPDLSPERVLAEVATPRGSRSLSSHLKSRLGLDGVKLGLLYELLPKEAMAQPQRLAQAIKGLPVQLRAPRPLDEAISSAGGVAFEALDDDFMLHQRPGVFCSGEMLDWEAPTGGYLLTACWATGRHAGQGAVRWLQALEQGDKE